MIIPQFLGPVVQYYKIYGPFLIIVTLILTITYTFISNFASIRSAYTCTTLKKVVNGSVGKCFGSRIGPTCRKSDIGYTHGWCNDAGNKGHLRGTRTGPYAVKCSDWIWNKSGCPRNIKKSSWNSVACPRGFKGPDSKGNCVAGWSTKCEEDCAKRNCAKAKGEWIPLDYRKNPYTCNMNSPSSRRARLKKRFTRKSAPAAKAAPAATPTPAAAPVPAPVAKSAPPAAAPPAASEQKYVSPWKQIAGQLKHISVDPSWTWGVNSKNEIYKCKTPCNTAAWSKVEGSLSQVDVGSQNVWGVNSGNDIYRRPKDGSGNWTKVNGKLKYVSAGPTGSVWGVNANDDIYMCTSRKKVKCTDNWKQIPGKLKQLSVGSKEVWGVNGSDNIYKRPVDGSGEWKQVTGQLKHVAVGGKEIVGVNSSDNIYVCKQPCNGNWTQINGKLKQVDATNRAKTVGVNSADNIYMRI